MSVHVALLSAVNVGGRKVAMAQLKAACLQEGWRRVVTVLASGNVVIDSGRQSRARVKARLEQLVETHFSVSTTAIMRTREELDRAIAQNPFQSFQPNLLLVNFLDDTPDPAGRDALIAKYGATEEFRFSDREMYMRFKSTVADSKLTAPVIKRTLRVVGTARNWNTVQKLRNVACEMEETA